MVIVPPIFLYVFSHCPFFSYYMISQSTLVATLVFWKPSLESSLSLDALFVYGLHRSSLICFPLVPVSGVLSPAGVSSPSGPFVWFEVLPSFYHQELIGFRGAFSSSFFSQNKWPFCCLFIATFLIFQNVFPASFFLLATPSWSWSGHRLPPFQNIF